MKSHVSDLLDLVACIYKDACSKCIAVKPDERDLRTIRSRVESEGLSFLTITLPAFCVDFERSLAEGYVDSTSFRSFKKNGAIPAFLQGMLNLLFDQGTGGLYDDSSIGCDDSESVVEGIRQICRAFTKISIDCTPERVHKAIENFVTVERDLNESYVSDADVDYFVDICNHCYGNMFADFDISDIIPRHGPGATAEGVSGNQKYSWQYWHDRLEPFFPLLDTAYSLSSYGSREFEDVKIVRCDDEMPVRVTAVPKTQKGPRIIAIEPCCMQYAQQGLRRYMYNRLENHRLTSGHVNFRDQSVNRDLAMRASDDGQMATLDLTDASDRVLLSLAIRMFDGNPDLQDAILACRSTRARLPDGRVIGPLAKFASMGSALCFPVESMYFYAICIGALLKEQGLPVTDRNVYVASRSVYVYGDDIIVPARLAIAVRDHLQKYHCKVNMRKSFWTGKFRESCGMDAYNGHEVTPTYVRHMHPTSRQQADAIVSWIKTAALFYKRGYWSTSSYLYNWCERYLGKLPYVADNSPMLGRISYQHFETIERWNRDHQVYEVKAWVAGPIYRTDRLEGYGALQKSLLDLAKRGDWTLSRASITIAKQPSRWFCGPMPLKKSGSDHLERSARHGAVALQRRWIAVD